MQQIKLSSTIQSMLCCPICKSNLSHIGEQFVCRDSVCSTNFPVIDGIPILLNEGESIFSFDDFLSFRNTTFDLRKNMVRSFVSRINKSTGTNVKAKCNFEKFTKILLDKSAHPKVLVIGGSIEGQGMGFLGERLELVALDVTFGPLTDLVGDAHSIPFENESFDGVIIQSVLEHVVDPYQCVEEIYRVLGPDGLVYSETPFMQQVHMGRFDFTRFTHLGHRRLFRKFNEIDSGACCGSGMALAWAYRGFLRSFANSRVMRVALGIFAASTSFYLKYFDYVLIDKPSSLDAASAYYFMGSKSVYTLSDRELVKLYRGAQQ